ncbi:MAG: metallophosphoesterase family protein [Longimicrobiales bacterium]
MRGDSPGVLVGVISDTHGLLRTEALDALQGSDLILHAGDVGGGDILEALEKLAPVVAIRGNTDRGSLARALPDTQAVEVAGHVLYLLHDIGSLDLSPEAAGFAAVVYGHTHQPAVREEGGVLYFNPGSAGHRRFDYPVTVGRIRVSAERLEPDFVDLLPPGDHNFSGDSPV